MPKVLIADDHPLVRAGLRQFLSEEPSITEIGEAASGTEAIEKLGSENWDLLILDISLPDRSGLEILHHSRLTHPDTKVLVLSGFPERQYALNMLRAGARGYLPKDCGQAELMKAVQTVLQGHRYVSATLGELLLSNQDADSSGVMHGRLSEREFQIFCKIAAGRTVASIAGELLLSPKTISTYRMRVLEKMSLSTNADLTLYALRNAIIQ